MRKSIGGIPTPVFYPSVSSVSKNTWTVIDHVELLVYSNYPQFLVSCFDIHKLKNNNVLKRSLIGAADKNQVILFDSGIYEVVWSRSKRWTRRKYLKILSENRVSHSFSFDEYVNFKNIPSIKNIVNDLGKTAKQIKKQIVSPILHCKSIDDYINYCVEISKDAEPKLIAIPERELGAGVIEVAKNIALIRSALNELDRYQYIHILGTGNPISMMVYAFAGADSFDGLDWCQTVVDYDTATLHHTLHYDFYSHQGKWGELKEISLLTKCFLHNLDFYAQWMETLRDAIGSGGEEAMISKYVVGPQREAILNLLGLAKEKELMYEITADK